MAASCEICGSEIQSGGRIVVDGKTLCAGCLELETATCCSCHRRIWQNSNAGNERTPLCHNCREEQYTDCPHCGSLVSIGLSRYPAEGGYGNPHCRGCFERYDQRNYFHNYNHKPTPIFYGEGRRWFGVELEIDDAGQDKFHAAMLCGTANIDKEHIYIKTDGSLDCGLEIVTHPMTLSYHMTIMPWKTLLHKALELGYKSHSAGTCGLHVHVSRSSLGDTVTEQDSCVSRILYLMERFWEELLRFSRRTEEQLVQWAKHYGYNANPIRILETAKGEEDRHSCLNIGNRDTIEFRIFRGTLRYNTLIATLQLVNELCSVALSMSDDDLTRLGWTDFMTRIDGTKTPELVAYLKERRLYINESVPFDEEV